MSTREQCGGWAWNIDDADGGWYDRYVHLGFACLSSVVFPLRLLLRSEIFVYPVELSPSLLRVSAGGSLVILDFILSGRLL